MPNIAEKSEHSMTVIRTMERRERLILYPVSLVSTTSYLAVIVLGSRCVRSGPLAL